VANKYRKAEKGKFRPKNPLKYDGDPTQIVYRSGLEKRMMLWLDKMPSVLSWSSECLIIPYYNPMKKRPARYFPDFLVKYMDSKGETHTMVVEVKSASEQQEPKKKSRVTRRLVESFMIWETNKAKWRAAAKFCEERGWKFKLLSEHDLGVRPK
jgi:hypothetical protein